MNKFSLLLLLFFIVAFGIGTVYAADVPAAYRVTAADIETAAAQALADKGAGARVQAVVTGAKPTSYYDSSTPVEIRISGLNFDKATNRWTANLLVESQGKVLTALPVGGRYQEVTRIPVLKRALQAGNTITDDDVDTLDFPLSRLRGDVVSDAAQLVGFSPRSSISPRRPIRTNEIATPALVHKNDIVTLRYASNSIEVSTSGQALSNAGKGEMVEVRNLSSKTVVRGRVEDAHTVMLAPLSEHRQLAGDLYAH